MGNKYIYIGKCAHPCTLFIHKYIGKIWSFSPCDHGRATESVSLSLSPNIWGVFCRKSDCLDVGMGVLVGTMAGMQELWVTAGMQMLLDRVTGMQELLGTTAGLQEVMDRAAGLQGGWVTLQGCRCFFLWLQKDGALRTWAAFQNHQKGPKGAL